jgi:hypothetical protein
MTADRPAPIRVSTVRQLACRDRLRCVEFLDWIVAIAEGRAADVEPAEMKAIRTRNSTSRSTRPMATKHPTYSIGASNSTVDVSHDRVFFNTTDVRSNVWMTSIR